MPNPLPFDQKCYELAALFLEETSAAGNADLTVALASEIQQTIEDFIEDLNGEGNE